MENTFSGVYRDRIQDTNIVRIQGYVFQANTFRSRTPREEGSSILAGKINNRDEIKVRPTATDV